MRRFLIPPLFGALFWCVQLAWEVLQWLSIGLFLRFVHTDFYLHLPAPASPSRLLPMILIGTACGAVFAALDWALHRGDDPSGGAALSVSLRHLRREGIVGFLLASYLFLIPQIVLFWWNSRTRYHPYSPQFQILDFLSLFPPLILGFTLLLVMGKTLGRKFK